MLQANELLYGILKTLGKIEENTRAAKGGSPAAPKGVGTQVRDKISALSNLGPSLLSFGRVKPKSIKDLFSFLEQFVAIGAKNQKSSKGLKNLAESLNLLGQGLPGLATGLDALGKIKQRQVQMALSTLESLYRFMEEKGDNSSSRKVDRAIKTFDKIAKTLQRIAKPIKDISLSFAYLGVGILAFAGSLLLTAMIMKLSSPKDVLLFLGVTILGLLVMFGMLALANRFIKKGTTTLVEMGLGLAALAFGLLSFAFAISIIPNFFKEGQGSIIKTMLIIGGILVVSALVFAGLSLMAMPVLIGVGVVLAMGVGFLLIALMTKKIISVANELKKDKVPIGDVISNMIGGVLNGFLGGISVLSGGKVDPETGKVSGGKTGIAGIAEFIKNSAKIFAGVAVLMSMSVALSMFAWALTAFVDLGNMRVIIGTDKNGKPIFGEKINVEQVGRTMTATLGNFLTGLIESTGQLTMSKAKALKKLGRALTGRRGVLSAIFSFAELLKTFAQFGPAGEIGYIDFVPDGVDEDGNAKFKQVPSKVKIVTVAANIANSFGTFVDELVKHTSIFDITGSKGKSMQNLASVLLGTKYFKAFGISFGREKPGLLEPIMKFAEILTTFGQFGTNQEIPILNAKGEQTGKVNVKDVANQIVANLTSFSSTLANAKISGDVEKASDNVKKYSGIIEELSKFSESLSSLEKAGDTISNLAKSISDLSVSLDGFDTSKLSKLAAISVSAGGTGTVPATAGGTTAERIQATAKAAKESSTPSMDWDVISAQIGSAVGFQLIDAMKKGQVKFEFSPSSPGKGVLSFD